MFRNLAAASLIVIASCCAVPAAEPSLAGMTVVAYNEAEPISIALAKLYAEQRGIPADHLVGLSCTIEEEISREDFENTIEKPLREEFRKRQWWSFHTDPDGKESVSGTKIRFLALIRGIPLKIRPTAQIPPNDKPGTGVIDSHNEASVDSELVLLPFVNHPISGVIPNPYYQSFRAIKEPGNPNFLLVCRLDAPTPDMVRRMITDSVAAEKTGLWGRAYVDRTHNTAPGGEMGDKWMSEIVEGLRKVGVPVVLDDLPEVLPPGFPMTDAALYYGWYAGGITGPFNQPDFRFVPGAIAVHIHSFSASTLRDPNAGWAGPLIARGAAATIGNVYEPYLQLTSHLDIFNDRLLHGFTLAESAYMSFPTFSWMWTVVGDPLYRPYASWLQLDETRDIGRGSQIWKAYHDFAVKNSFRPAVEYRTQARLFAMRTRNGPMLEDLGLMEVAANNFGPATGYLQQARACYTRRDDILRTVLELGDAFLKDRKPRRAVELVRSVLRITPDAPAAPLLKKLEQQAEGSPTPTP